MSFRTAHAVDNPRMNLSGLSESAASAYAQRLTARSTSVVSLSNTKAAAKLSICPVTGPIPSGSGNHLARSSEYSVAQSDSVVGRAPLGLAGSTKIDIAPPGIAVSPGLARGAPWPTSRPRRCAQLVSQSSIFRPKMASASSPACAPITLTTHSDAASASSSSAMDPPSVEKVPDTI